MGVVFEEFQRHLGELDREFKDKPDKEFASLFLLALEREQIVSTGYRESAIAQRLNQMPLGREVQEVIRHALLWAWKDEEMHAVYVRGLILKFGPRLMRYKAFSTQAAGAVGGWAASVQQHALWKHAPFSRFVASLLSVGGRLSGKIPKNVSQHLQYGPFRNFCLFNVDAEKTAWLCWHRLAELAGKSKAFPVQLSEEFLRIQDDEMRHERVFQILADSLSDSDELLPNESADSLVEKLKTAGEFFLPRAFRKTFVQNNPIGCGGKVTVIKGRTVLEKSVVFRDFLQSCGIEESLTARAEQLGKPLTEFRVAVKTTFMLGYDKKDLSPLTDPDLLDQLGDYLKSSGCRDVFVLEAPNIYDKFYANRSVPQVATYFGIASPHYKLVDISKDQVPHCYSRGLGQSVVSRTWKEADFRISFSKMRSHPVELALLTVGNLEGIGSRCEEFIFVERQAHRETAVMTLINDFPPHFALLDAYQNVPDGILGVMGCPRPKQVLRFYGGKDALAVDMIAARHLGVKNPHQSSLLEATCQWFGTPQDVEVIGPDDAIKDWRGPYHNELSTGLSLMALPVYVMGSGRGAVFVPEMDIVAFPPLLRESLTLRFTRKFLQAFLGLRHPRS